MDPGEPLPYENIPPKTEGVVPLGRRNKRRSSILKPSNHREVLQDLNPNCGVSAAPPPQVQLARPKSRRVSFSRTQQVKEFQTGSQTLTIWNNTYEEDHGNASSASVNSSENVSQQNSSGNKLSAAASADKQPPAAGSSCQLSSAAAVAGFSGNLPLLITIPDASSPNKFLPTNPGMDTSDILTAAAGRSGPGGVGPVDAVNFLQSIGGVSTDNNKWEDEEEDDDCYATRLPDFDRTCRDEVSMARTMMESFETSVTSDTSTTAKVDALGFLAGLTSANDVSDHPKPVTLGPNPEYGHSKEINYNPEKFSVGMDVTCPINPSLHENELNGMDITCKTDKVPGGIYSSGEKDKVSSGMDITCMTNDMAGGMDITRMTDKIQTGMDITCRTDKIPTGMDITCRKDKIPTGMDITCRTDKIPTGMDITCRTDKIPTGMDITCRTDKIPTGMDITCRTDKVPTGMDMTCMTQQLGNIKDPTCTTDRYQSAFSSQNSSVKTGSAGSNKDLVSDFSQDSVFTRDVPGVDEDNCGSGNSSYDGGATATVKFSRLAFANNTLLLPARSSNDDEDGDDDDDMTKVPIQIINYNAEDPIVSLPESVAPAHSLQPERNICSVPQSVAVPDNGIEQTRSQLSCNTTSAEPVNMEITWVPGIRLPPPTNLEATRACPADMELTRMAPTSSGVQSNFSAGVVGHLTQLDAVGMELTRIQRKDRDLTKAVDSTEFTMDNQAHQSSDQRNQDNHGWDKTVADVVDMDVTKPTLSTPQPIQNQPWSSENLPQRMTSQDVRHSLLNHGHPTTVDQQERIEMPSTLITQANHHRDINRLLSEQFLSPAESPEPTAVLGGMLLGRPRGGPPQLADMTINFAPTGESTRRFQFTAADLEGCAEPSLDMTEELGNVEIEHKEVEEKGKENLKDADNCLQNVEKEVLPVPVELEKNAIVKEMTNYQGVDNHDNLERITAINSDHDMMSQLCDEGKLSREAHPESNSVSAHSIEGFTSPVVNIFSQETLQSTETPIARPNKCHETETISSNVSKRQSMDQPPFESPTKKQKTESSPPQVPESFPIRLSADDLVTFGKPSEILDETPSNNSAGKANSDEGVERDSETLQNGNEVESTGDIAICNKETVSVPIEVDTDRMCVEESNAQTERGTNSCGGLETDVSPTTTNVTPALSDDKQTANIVEYCVELSAAKRQSDDERDVNAGQSTGAETAKNTIASPTALAQAPLQYSAPVQSLAPAPVPVPAAAPVNSSVPAADPVPSNSTVPAADPVPSNSTVPVTAPASANSPAPTPDPLPVPTPYSAPVSDPVDPVPQVQPVETRRKSLAFETVSVFVDLDTRREDEEVAASSWRLVEYVQDCKLALFSWMHNSLVLDVILGEKLEPKKTRKTIGRIVDHFSILRMKLHSVHSFQDPALDAAHNLVVRKFSPAALLEKCPNTYSLGSLLRAISSHVSPAMQFYSALFNVEGRFITKINNCQVTIGFASPLLCLGFDLSVSYRDGLSQAGNNIAITKSPGGIDLPPEIGKVVSSVSLGPDHVTKLAEGIELVISILEEKKRKRSK